MKKWINIFIVLFLIICLSGCGFWKNKHTSKEFIEKGCDDITNMLINGELEDFYELFDNISDDEKEDLIRFKNNLSDVKRIYVSENGYEYGDGMDDGVPYELVKNIQGFIITDNNIYSYLIDFTVYDEEEIVISRFWLISGRTEAIENKDWPHKYHFPSGLGNKTHIVYADYYDSDVSRVNNYKFVWGHIVEWNDNSRILELSDFDKSDLNKLSYNEIISKYGKFAGEYDTVYGYHCIFYKTNEEGKYTQIFFTEDDIAEEVAYTDEIGYDTIGIKRIR